MVFGMIWLRSEAVYVRKSGSVKHFYEARFRWVESEVVESLIFRHSFIHERHDWLFTRKDYSLHEK